MKTITFSHSHLVQLRVAMENRISELEKILATISPNDPDCMRYRDCLDVARQALVLLESA
jgi:hypothetical protein